jgi:hypothetical protein
MTRTPQVHPSLMARPNDASPVPLVGNAVDGLMFAPCSHAPGLLAWLAAALRPLPFAKCFSAAEERPGGVLALPNGFLKTLITQRYGDELDRYAASAGLERIEIVVDPAVSAVSADSARERPPEAPPPVPPVREQPPGLTACTSLQSREAPPPRTVRPRADHLRKPSQRLESRIPSLRGILAARDRAHG